MNLMIFYSRIVAGRRLWHSPMADPVRRTSEKFVGSHLPRPLTSPSCRASRHPAPALTSVECERVSGSRMETLVDDLGDILLELWTVNRIKKSFTVQGRDTPVPAQPHVVKRAPLRRYRAIVVIRRWAARPRTRSGEGDTRTGRSRRGSRADDEMSLCSSSPAVAGAAGKRSYHKITGSAEGTVAAATIRGGADGSDDARSDETKTGPIDK